MNAEVHDRINVQNNPVNFYDPLGLNPFLNPNSMIGQVSPQYFPGYRPANPHQNIADTFESANEWSRERLNKNYSKIAEKHKSNAQEYKNWANFHRGMAEEVWAALPPCDGGKWDILALIMTEASRQAYERNLYYSEIEKMEQKYYEEAAFNSR